MQIGVETSKAVDQRRVFVIDEDEITRAVLQFMLQDEIETHEHANPEDARQSTNEWLRPDVILLGATFLAARGTGLIAELASSFPGVRIIVVHNPDDENLALEGMKAGAHGTLGKPLRVETVRRKVDTILGRGGAAPLVQLGFMN